jgi:hypothetical protein
VHKPQNWVDIRLVHAAPRELWPFVVFDRIRKASEVFVTLECNLNKVREFAVLEPPEIFGAFLFGFPTLGLDETQDVL